MLVVKTQAAEEDYPIHNSLKKKINRNTKNPQH